MSQKEDAHLVATLLPKSSPHLPRVPHKNLAHFYPYSCYRLACEQLFGQVACYVQYSSNVPADEFKDEHEDMVVAQVRKHVVQVPVLAQNCNTLL